MPNITSNKIKQKVNILSECPKCKDGKIHLSIERVEYGDYDVPDYYYYYYCEKCHSYFWKHNMRGVEIVNLSEPQRQRLLNLWKTQEGKKK
jgi:uncharacterized protein with PIN domain